MNIDFKIDNNLLELNRGVNRESIKQSILKELDVAGNTKEILKGFCKKCFGNGDLVVEYKGIECTLLIQDFTAKEDPINRHLAQNKVGTKISFRVKEIDRDKVYIERKSIITEVRNIYATLQVGHNISATVIRIDQDKGGFVDIGGDIQAIIPKSMITNVFVNDVSNHLEIGEIVNAKVVELERDSNGNIIHLALNRKVLLPTFVEMVKDIKQHDVMMAKVKKVGVNGVHCSLNQHLDIFCAFAPELKVCSGDMVRVLVKQVREDRERINGNILGKL